MRLVTAADCGRQLRANAQQNVAEQAEREMLHISHDFTQNTLDVHRAGERSYRTS